MCYTLLPLGVATIIIVITLLLLCLICVSMPPAGLIPSLTGNLYLPLGCLTCAAISVRAAHSNVKELCEEWARALTGIEN